MKLKALVALAMGAAFWACESPTEAGPEDVRSVSIISGDGQTVAPGATTPKPIVIEVKDGSGKPIRFINLFWEVNHKDGGSIGGIPEAEARTNNDGRASGLVRTDSVPGEYVVTIYAGRYENEAGDTITVTGTAKVFAN